MIYKEVYTVFIVIFISMTQAVQSKITPTIILFIHETFNIHSLKIYHIYVYIVYIVLLIKIISIYCIVFILL